MMTVGQSELVDIEDKVNPINEDFEMIEKIEKNSENGQSETKCTYACH